MDQTTQASQFSIPPTNTSNLPPTPKKSSKKWLLLSGILAGMLLVIGGLYFFMMNQKPTKIFPAPSTTPTQTPTVSVPSTDSGIPITAKTVSFTRVNGQVYLRYKGKLYSEEAANKNDASLTKLTNPDQYTWSGLVDAPNVASDLSGFDEVFDFKVFPNKQNFIFIMRWPTDEQINNFEVFYYDAAKTQEKITTLLSLTSVPNLNNVPRIKQISNDANYVAFDMFSCWNCGGHQPVTMLYNMETKANQRIGETSYFAWKENGKYEYKAYKEIPCPTEMEGPVICSEDPSKLPLLTGTF